MNREQYLEMLYVFHNNMRYLIVEWCNGLKVKCLSFTGLMETDTEPGDEDYIGEYSVGLTNVEVLTPGRDDSVEIYKGSIEISLKCIPERISLPDGTLLWERKD